MTVKTNPSGQTCTVTSGSGTIGSANVTNVAVTCSNVVTYTIGGTVSGLSGTVVLQDNGGDNLSVTGNGSFTFATPVVAGGAYSVTVKTNPSGQTCTVSGGSGTAASANITSVAVSCSAAASYTIGGTVSGLSGTVVLQDNGGDNLSVTGNGSFTFATPWSPGAPTRDGEDQPVRPDLHGLRRFGHGGLGRRHQCRGLLHGWVSGDECLG